MQTIYSEVGVLFFRFPTCACYIYGPYIFYINIQMLINSSQSTEFRYDILVYLYMMVIIEKHTFIIDQTRLIIQECEIKPILFQERDKWSHSVSYLYLFSMAFPGGSWDYPEPPQISNGLNRPLMVYIKMSNCNILIFFL